MSVRDLNDNTVVIPEMIVIDTNLLISHFLGKMFPMQNQVQTQRAGNFFLRLRKSNSVGFVTDTSVGEYIHYLITAKLLGEVPTFQPALVAHYGGRPTRKFKWRELYKIKPWLVSKYGSDIKKALDVLYASDLYLLQPEDFDLNHGGTWETELGNYIQRYSLLANDARILMDAASMGIDNIATLDGDLRSAQKDFEVYTWV